MSHSWRHSPFTGMSFAESEKKDKELASRRLRRREKMALREGTHDPDLVLPHRLEVTNPATFAKDGKQRICPVEHAKLMRK